MRLSRVKSGIAELKSVVDSWDSTPSNEQLAATLAMVKDIYSELRFCGKEEQAEEIVVTEITEITEITVEKTPSEDELRKERLQNIKSLYGDTTPAAPVVPAEPVITVVSTEPKESISSMLTINDRFLLSNDLFDGNMVQLNNALQELDNQPSLDDALLYIAQNYRWNGDSDGAKLLNTLLKKRF